MFSRCFVSVFQKRSTQAGIGHQVAVQIHTTSTWIDPLVINALSCSSGTIVSSHPSLITSNVFFVVDVKSKRWLLSRIASMSCVHCFVRLRWSTHAKKVRKREVSLVSGKILCVSPAKTVNHHFAVGNWTTSSLIFSFAYASLDFFGHPSSTSILCETSSASTISWSLAWNSDWVAENQLAIKKERNEQKNKTVLQVNTVVW